MPEILEMSLSPQYSPESQRRIRLLKLLRIVLICCLILSWIYGISVAAALLEQTNGSATLWILFFVIFTVPATALLILVHRGLTRLTREYDYCLENDCLLIYACNGNRRRLLVTVPGYAVIAFAPEAEAGPWRGKSLCAAPAGAELWALDFRNEEQKMRVLLQPNEAFCRRLQKYAR